MTVTPILTLDTNPPAGAPKVSGFVLNGVEYEVFAVFKDDKGNPINLPTVTFDADTLSKTEEAIKALMIAHDASRALAGKGPASIKSFSIDGALYEGETTQNTHNFAINSVLNRANTLALSPYNLGSAQLIWDEIARLITAKLPPLPKPDAATPLEERDLSAINLTAPDWGIEATIEQQIKILGNIVNERIEKVEKLVRDKLEEIYDKRTEEEIATDTANNTITKDEDIKFKDWVAVIWINLMTNNFRKQAKLL